MADVIELSPETILELPVDELAMRVLADLVSTREWNEGNYLGGSGLIKESAHFDLALDSGTTALMSSRPIRGAASIWL